MLGAEHYKQLGSKCFSELPEDEKEKSIKYLTEHSILCDNVIGFIEDKKPEFLELVSAKKYIYEETEKVYQVFPETKISYGYILETPGVKYVFEEDGFLFCVMVRSDCNKIDLTKFPCFSCVSVNVYPNDSFEIVKDESTDIKLCLRGNPKEDFIHSVSNIVFHGITCFSGNSTTKSKLKVKKVPYYLLEELSFDLDILESVTDVSSDNIEYHDKIKEIKIVDTINTDKPLAATEVTVTSMKQLNLLMENIEYFPKLETLIVAIDLENLKLSELPEATNYEFRYTKGCLTIDRPLNELTIKTFKHHELCFDKVFKLIKFDEFPTEELTISDLVFQFRDTRANKVKSAAKV